MMEPWECGRLPGTFYSVVIESRLKFSACRLARVARIKRFEESNLRSGNSEVSTMSLSANVASSQPVTENPLKALSRFGQAIWLDYIRRSLISTGELARLIREDGLRG